MMQIHVDGTRRLLHAAKAAGVRRVLLASTSGTIAISRDPEPVPDETWPYPVDLCGNWPYYLSKIYQEKLALDLAPKLGLELVVVNPSLLLGPGDRRGSSTTDVRKFLCGEIPVVPAGGVSFVDKTTGQEREVEREQHREPGWQAADPDAPSRVAGRHRTVRETGRVVGAGAEARARRRIGGRRVEEREALRNGGGSE